MDRQLGGWSGTMAAGWSAAALGWRSHVTLCYLLSHWRMLSAAERAGVRHGVDVGIVLVHVVCGGGCQVEMGVRGETHHDDVQGERVECGVPDRQWRQAAGRVQHIEGGE